MKPLFSRLRNDWATPPEIFGPLEAEFGPFDLDPAATPANAKVKAFYTIEDNGLSKPWKGRVWLNPPYGRGIADWMQKAHYEVHEGSADVVVCLLPARTDTAWWHDWVQGKAEVRFLRGRIRFIGPTGMRMAAAPFPSVIVIYEPSTET